MDFGLCRATQKKVEVSSLPLVVRSQGRCSDAYGVEFWHRHVFAVTKGLGVQIVYLFVEQAEADDYQQLVDCFQQQDQSLTIVVVPREGATLSGVEHFIAEFFFKKCNDIKNHMFDVPLIALKSTTT